MDLGKDSHGSTFHQGLNELQEVSGDDREGILHEELQVSHNLCEIGHSQSQQNVTDLVTAQESLLVLCDGEGQLLSSWGPLDVLLSLCLVPQEEREPKAAACAEVS